MWRIWVEFVWGCTRFSRWLVTPSDKTEAYQESSNRNTAEEKEPRTEKRSRAEAAREETNAWLEKCLNTSTEEQKKR